MFGGPPFACYPLLWARLRVLWPHSWLALAQQKGTASVRCFFQSWGIFGRKSFTHEGVTFDGEGVGGRSFFPPNSVFRVVFKNAFPGVQWVITGQKQFRLVTEKNSIFKNFQPRWPVGPLQKLIFLETQKMQIHSFVIPVKRAQPRLPTPS